MKACILGVLALLLGASAFAQPHYRHGYHGHGYYGPRVGFYFGAPYPWYAPPPPYYYSPPVVYQPVVTVREAPTVYIEQDEAVAPAPAVQPQQAFEAGYWYYCRERKAYYPSVSSCPGSWQKVAPASGTAR